MYFFSFGKKERKISLRDKERESYTVSIRSFEEKVRGEDL